MSREDSNVDQKSLRKVTGTNANWPALAADCVCFANASGGCLRIGIEDNADQPPADQRISDELMEQIRKRVAELTVNVQVAPELAQRTIRRALEELVAQGQVQFEGERRWRRYSLVDKGQSP